MPIVPSASPFSELHTSSLVAPATPPLGPSVSRRVSGTRRGVLMRMDSPRRGHETSTRAKRALPQAPFLAMAASSHPPRRDGASVGEGGTCRSSFALAAVAAPRPASSCGMAACVDKPPPHTLTTARPAAPHRVSGDVFSLAPVRSSAEWCVSPREEASASDRVRLCSAGSSSRPPLASTPRSPIQNVTFYHAHLAPPPPHVLAGRTCGSASVKTPPHNTIATAQPCRLSSRPPSSAAAVRGTSSSSDALASAHKARATSAQARPSQQFTTPRVRYSLAPPRAASVGAPGERTPGDGTGAPAESSPSSPPQPIRPLSPRSTAARTPSAVGHIRPTTPQGLYEAGLAAYQYYQTRLHQTGCTAPPPAVSEEGEPSSSRHDVDDRVLNGMVEAAFTQSNRVTFTKTATGEALRFSFSSCEDDAAEEFGNVAENETCGGKEVDAVVPLPLSRQRVAQTHHCFQDAKVEVKAHVRDHPAESETSQTADALHAPFPPLKTNTTSPTEETVTATAVTDGTQGWTADLAPHQNRTASLLTRVPSSGAVLDSDAKACRRDESEYLQRRHIRAFEDRYHSPRLHPTTTPLLDALMSRVAVDYFETHQPPSVVRCSGASRAPSVADLSSQHPPDEPTRPTEVKEGCIELGGWLELNEARVAARELAVVETDTLASSTSSTCTHTPEDGVASAASAEPAHTVPLRQTDDDHAERIFVHADRVLTALSQAHGRKLRPGNRTAAERGGSTRPAQPRSGAVPFTWSEPALSISDEDEDEDEEAVHVARNSQTHHRGRSRVPLPQRLAQCLRRHTPLMHCVSKTARLMVYFLMRALPAELYVGDPGDYAELQAVEKGGLTRLVRRIESSTPHLALSLARQRVVDEYSRMEDTRALAASTVIEICCAEWQSLCPAEAVYIPVLSSMEALTWLLLPDGAHDRLTGDTSGTGGGGGDESVCTNLAPSRTVQQWKSLVRDDPVCRVLWLLLSCRANACEALATVLEEAYTCESPTRGESKARLFCHAPLPSVAASTRAGSGGSGFAHTQYCMVQEDMAELVQWLRAAGSHGGHLDVSSRARALHVFYATLGHVETRIVNTSTRTSASYASPLPPTPSQLHNTNPDRTGAPHDLLNLVFAPCSFLTLAIAVLLHVSDAPPQVHGEDAVPDRPRRTETRASTREATQMVRPPPVYKKGRPRCLHPQLVASHGGYGQAPFTAEARQHMLQRRDLVCRLLDVAFTNTESLSRSRGGADGDAVIQFSSTDEENDSEDDEADGEGSPRKTHARSHRRPHTLASPHRASSPRRSPAALSASLRSVSSFGESVADKAETEVPCEADRQAHYAYLHPALQPPITYLPLEAVHHVLSCSVTANAKVPLEWAEEDVGSAELELLLDLMHSFSQLSMSLSSNRKATLADKKLEIKSMRHNQKQASAPGRRAAAHTQRSMEERTRTCGDAAAIAAAEKDASSDAFFFEFHRETLLKWCALVCSEAATSYAMELAGPGLGDFAFTTYDTTSELSETQQEAVMSSPIASLALPSTLILPDSRHLAPLVLDRCRRVVLEAVAQLKGETMFLLTGVDSRDKLLTVHRTALLGVQRAEDARRQYLWRQRELRESAKRQHHRAQNPTDAGGETVVSILHNKTRRPCAEGDADGGDDRASGNSCAEEDEEEEKEKETEEEEGETDKDALWALRAVRKTVSACAKAHAEQVLERIFLCCPLYSRDGKHEVTSLSEVVMLAPPSSASSASFAAPSAMGGVSLAPTTATPPHRGVHGVPAQTPARVRSATEARRSGVMAATNPQRPSVARVNRHVGGAASSSPSPSPSMAGTHERVPVKPCRTRVRQTVVLLTPSSTPHSPTADATPASPLDLSIPEALRLETVYDLMYAMEESRLVSNRENVLFNGSLTNIHNADRGFHPLGPKWTRSQTSLVEREAATTPPLFPTNTVTRATVQRSAAARAASAAITAARKSGAMPGTHTTRPSSSSSASSRARTIPREEAGHTEATGLNFQTPPPPPPSAGSDEETPSHQEDPLASAMDVFLTRPRPCSSWFEVGKEGFEVTRLAARLRRPVTHHAFDLNSVSPLVALTTCVLPEPTLTVPSPTRVSMPSRGGGGGGPQRQQEQQQRGNQSAHLPRAFSLAMSAPTASSLAAHATVPTHRLSLTERFVPSEAVATTATTATAETRCVSSSKTGRPPRAASAGDPRCTSSSTPVMSPTTYADSIRHNPFLVRPGSSSGAASSTTSHPSFSSPASPLQLSGFSGRPSAMASRTSPPRARQSSVQARGRQPAPGTHRSSTLMSAAAITTSSSRPGTGAGSTASGRPASGGLGGAGWQPTGLGRIGSRGTAATAPVNTRAQSTRVSMRERLGFRVGEHLMPWTS